MHFDCARTLRSADVGNRHRPFGQDRHWRVAADARELGVERALDILHRLEMRAAHVFRRQLAVQADTRLDEDAREQLRLPLVEQRKTGAL